MRSSPQVMHAAVMAAFPPGFGRRPLWRLDEDDDRLELFIASESRPSFSHLQEQAGWEAEETWAIRDYDPLLARLQRGQRYAFRLVANPTHVAEVAPGVKKRVGHVSPRHQLRWLLERAERIGVAFPRVEEAMVDDEADADVRVRLTQRRRVEFARQGAKVTLVQVRFEGELDVVDVDALRTALREGIGRGKAYGCALLTLARG